MTSSRLRSPAATRTPVYSENPSQSPHSDALTNGPGSARVPRPTRASPGDALAPATTSAAVAPQHVQHHPATQAKLRKRLGVTSSLRRRPRTRSSPSLFVLIPTRQHRRPQPRRRREHAVTRHEMPPRPQHEPEQPLDQHLRRHHHVHRAALSPTLQLAAHPTSRQQLHESAQI